MPPTSTQEEPTATASLPSQEQRKKRRLEDHVDEEVPPDDPTSAGNNDEIEKLQKQVKELRYMLLQALQDDLDWNNLSERWKEDRELVLVVARHRKVDWKDLSRKWRMDPEVALATMESSLYPTIVDWDNLPMKSRSNSEIAIAALRKGRIHRWDQVPTSLQEDPNVILSALEFNSDIIEFEDVSDDIVESHPAVALYGVNDYQVEAEACDCLGWEVLKKAVEDAKIEWTLLPENLRNDISFAKSISQFSDGVTAMKILERFPELRNDRSY